MSTPVISLNSAPVEVSFLHLSLASHYSITSSARASSVGGTSRAEHLGRLEVDHQFELGRQLYGNDCPGVETNHCDPVATIRRKAMRKSPSTFAQLRKAARMSPKSELPSKDKHEAHFA